MNGISERILTVYTKFETFSAINSAAGDSNRISRPDKCPNVTLKSVMKVLTSGTKVLLSASLRCKLNFRYLKVETSHCHRLRNDNLKMSHTHKEMTIPFRSNTTFVLYKFHPSALHGLPSPVSAASSSQLRRVTKFTTTYFLALCTAHEIF